jgi:hypothetical protein
MITRIGNLAPSLDMVSTYGVYGMIAPGQLFTVASVTAAARTEYYALDIPSVMVVRRFWWANGANTTDARTVIMALYGDAGFKPGSKVGTAGTATQGTINQLQFVAPSGGDFSISPGTYWLAVATSSATNATMMGASNSTAINAANAFQEATVTPPTTATPLEKTSATFFLCGFSTTTLV